MKLLAIETATEACSAALWLNGEVLEQFELAPRRHTEIILPMVDTLLTEAGLHLSQLDGLAFGCGPGSFTGIRIATGVIQGLALAAERPVVRVSTLASLAQSRAHEHPRIIAALDARMDEVYWGCYEWQEGCMRLQGEEMVCPPDAVTPPDKNDWFGAGNGWDRYAEVLKNRLVPRQVTVIENVWPRAAASAAIAAVDLAAGKTVSAAEARPTYLRDRVAHAK